MKGLHWQGKVRHQNPRMCLLLLLTLLAQSLLIEGSTEVEYSGDEENRNDTNTTVSSNNTRKTNNWREYWNESWTNWIAVNNPHPPMTPKFVNFSEAKFLSILHSGYKGANGKCEDKNRVDCPVWANLGYCNHTKTRYTTWMAENCPESCNLCVEEELVKPGKECKNLRQTCERLSRFCVGPFKNYMKEWCPKTCSFCNTTDEDDTEGSGYDLNEALDIELTRQTSHTKTAKYDSNEDDQVCFPTNCGTAPAMRNRWLQLQHHSRMTRALRRETRKRRSSSVAQDIVNRRAFSGLTPPPTYLKIVGGAWAKKGEWPWHGLILQKVGKYIRFCGITIICKKWLITAAHCLASTEFGFPETKGLMNTFTVYVGRHQGMFGYMESSTQVFSKHKLKRFIIHPQFKIMPSFNFDIALVELSTNIEFNAYVQPVCIPTVNSNKHNDMLWAYGWGVTLGYGPSAKYLKKVDLPYVEKEECARLVWGLPKAGILCAGGKARKDTCTGDSGGSLVKRADDNRYYIYGVTSYGNKHCNSRYPYSPGIYTDVSYFYEWIRKETKGCCSSRNNGIIFLKDSSTASQFVE